MAAKNTKASPTKKKGKKSPGKKATSKRLSKIPGVKIPLSKFFKENYRKSKIATQQTSPNARLAATAAVQFIISEIMSVGVQDHLGTNDSKKMTRVKPGAFSRAILGDAELKHLFPGLTTFRGLRQPLIHKELEPKKKKSVTK